MVTVINTKYFDITTTKTEDGKYQTSYLPVAGIGKEKEKKEIVKIFHIYSDQINAENSKISLTEKPGDALVITQTNDNPYDEEIFIVAVPYNGIIEPIGRSYEFRLHRAYLAQLDDGKGKVVYMVVSFNTPMLNPESKYHQDVISFYFNYYYRKTKAVDGEKETTGFKHIFAIDVNSDGHEVYEREESPVEANAEEFRKQKTFTFYSPNRNNNRRNTNFRSSNPEKTGTAPDLPASDVNGQQHWKKTGYDNQKKKPAPKTSRNDRQKRGFEKDLPSSRNISTKDNAWDDKKKDDDRSAISGQKIEHLTQPVIQRGANLDKMIADFQKENKERTAKKKKTGKNGKKRR